MDGLVHSRHNRYVTWNLFQSISAFLFFSTALFILIASRNENRVVYYLASSLIYRTKMEYNRNEWIALFVGGGGIGGAHKVEWFQASSYVAFLTHLYFYIDIYVDTLCGCVYEAYLSLMPKTPIFV